MQNTITLPENPGYTLSLKKEGVKIYDNQASHELTALAKQVEAMKRRQDASYAGALLLDAFLEYSGLQDCKFSLCSHDEFDDQGGYYATAYAVIEKITGVEDIKDDPELMADIEGALDSLLNDNAYDLYTGIVLREPNGDDSRDVFLCRSQIQPLLDRISSNNLECIDGIEAFKLFFPEALKLSNSSSPKRFCRLFRKKEKPMQAKATFLFEREFQGRYQVYMENPRIRLGHVFGQSGDWLAHEPNGKTGPRFANRRDAAKYLLTAYSFREQLRPYCVSLQEDDGDKFRMLFSCLA